MELLAEHNFEFIERQDLQVTVKCLQCNTHTSKTRQYFNPCKFDPKMCKTCNPRAPMAADHKEKIRQSCIAFHK